MKTVIIGGVAAGMSAAAKLKRELKDEQIIVYEKTNEVSYGACGLPYYVSGENDDIDKMRIRSAEDFKKNGIDVYLNHEVVKVDPEQKTITIVHHDKRFEDTYDRLIVATGSSPIVLPIAGVDDPRVFTLKTLQDGEKLKAATQQATSVAIIGGGYIGLELAEAFLTQKKKVSIIERFPVVLATFDKEFSEMVASHLQENGVKLYLDQTVTEIKPHADHLTLITDQTQVDADIVVMSVGIRPNTSFLNNTKISMLPNGAIITDEKMRTNIPDIYAAGDCSTIVHAITKKPAYIPLGTNANKQGRVLAEILAGQDKKFDQGLGSAMIKIIDLEVAKTGLSEKEAKDHGLDVITSTVTSYDHAGYYPNPTDITIKIVADKKTRILLGAQLIGQKNAVLRMNPFVVAIDQKMTAEEFSLLDFGYAPPFAAPWDVMHIATSTLK